MPAETQGSRFGADRGSGPGADTTEAPAAGGPSALTVNSSPDSASPVDDLPTLSTSISKIPVQLDLRVPVPFFRVQDLLSLEKGRVLETAWSNGEDLPLWAGDVLMVWTEFEVIEQKLAVRVTRLA